MIISKDEERKININGVVIKIVPYWKVLIGRRERQKNFVYIRGLFSRKSIFSVIFSAITHILAESYS